MRKTLRAWSVSALGGLGLLGLLRALDSWLGFSLQISTAPLAVAAGLGVPGVTTLLLLRILFRL